MKDEKVNAFERREGIIGVRGEMEEENGEEYEEEEEEE